MERILLVEPNYKNKYPPIGLMKISSYFKSKGDYVFFSKGLLPHGDAATFDKVFITTLFTFDFDICVDTIRYYIEIVGIEKVFVGGIAATIMPQNFTNAIPGLNILTGQLTSSSLLGYDDNINIDILELDYDILWDIAYEYPASDSYFIYTSRGCPRKCPFCAVKTLEPIFYECENIREQIARVDDRFGTKKQLLIMDNNALHCENLSKNIDILVDIGFGSDNNTAKKNNPMPFYLASLRSRINEHKPYGHLLNRIKKDIIGIKFSRIRSTDKEILENAITQFGNDNFVVNWLLTNSEYLIEFYDRYTYHNIKRYVDFNQGLDARFFNDENAYQLSRLALKPCRIAFDDIKTKASYFKAMDLAVKNGISHFSNYLLFNFHDKPTDLWQRLFLNVQYCNTHKEIASLFSFPMKYAAIERTDREFIGEHWNKKHLKSINVIINVTSGVVAKELDFFLRAFGASEEEYIEILTMPDDFIRYRSFFETYNLQTKWRAAYRALSDQHKNELLQILSKCEKEVDAIQTPHSIELDNILLFYTMKKKQIEKNMTYYLQLFDKL